jgi:hypothetical protein
MSGTFECWAVVERLISRLLPTLRKEREGWGTLEFVVG